MNNHLTKQDWFEVFRDNVKIREINDYLKTQVNQLYCTKKSYEYPLYKYIICAALEDFLEFKKYSIERKVGIYDDSFHALQKEDIEISYKKFKKCVTEGLLFITIDSKRFVIALEDDYQRWTIKIFYKEEDENSALNFLNELEAYSKEHNYLKNAKIDVDLRHICLDKEYTWDDIILPDEMLRELQVNTANLFEDLALYRENNLTFKRGLILKGIPGTGKTLLGKILCSQAKCSFIWVTPKFLTHANRISLIGDLARELSPSILFLEDIDLYGENRDSSSNPVLLGELMNQLDGLIENKFVVTIATTNRPEKIEDALSNRPGRFDRVLDMPKPDMVCRKKMLQLYIGTCICKDINLDKLTSCTDGFTGAHIKEFVMAAILEAIESNSLTDNKKIILREPHFTDSLSKVKAKDFTPIGFNVADKFNPKFIDDDCPLPPV
jgi:cell division protease FtsH